MYANNPVIATSTDAIVFPINNFADDVDVINNSIVLSFFSLAILVAVIIPY